MCLLGAFDNALLLKDRELADSLYNACSTRASGYAEVDQALRTAKFSYLSKFGSKEEIHQTLSSIDINEERSSNEYLHLAQMCRKAGELDKAEDFLGKSRQELGKEDMLEFYAVAVPIFKKAGKYKEAFDYYWAFSKIMDSITVREYEQRARFSTEKHALELQKQKETQDKSILLCLLLMGLVLIIFLCIIIFLIRRRHTAEKEAMSLRMGELERESQDLHNLLSSRNTMPLEVRKAVEERFNLLNAFLRGEIGDNSNLTKENAKKVKELIENREDFMCKNRLALQGESPAFIEELEKHGLTQDEINYTCLYGLGLTGKEIGIYLNKPSHIHISTTIRKKLGLTSHDKNLAVIVREMVSQARHPN